MLFYLLISILLYANFTGCRNIPLILIENFRNTSINLCNKNFIIILTVFVSDFDINDEGENVDEDEGVEGEVERHVSQRTIKSCCFTSVSILLYTNYTTCQNIPLMPLESVPKTSTNFFNKNFYHVVDYFCFRFREQRGGPPARGS